MQDFDAVLADDGLRPAGVRTRRLTGATREAASVAQAVGEPLPQLLDTRLVRAELTRLRGPGREVVVPSVRRRGA